MDDFDRLIKKIPKIITETVDKELMNDLGKESVERITRRTRVGKGVRKNEGPTHKLPKLKNRTVKERQRLKNKGELTGPGATPGRSGVNRTGKTLNEMEYVAGNSEVEIKLSKEGQRRARNIVKIDPDYEFMNLSKSEVKSLVKIIEEKVIQVIKKLNL